MKRPLRSVGVLLACTLVLGACGDDDDDGDVAGDVATTIAGATTTVGGAAAADTVTIKNFAFSALSTKAGSKVTVKNDDAAPHTYTADDDKFDSGRVEPGKTAEFTAPSDAGTYKVHCEVHSSMTGTLTVT